MRALVKNVLERLYLLDGLRSLRQAPRRLAWEVERKWRHTDEELVSRHLGGGGARKLHIGCGANLLDGWLNADFRPTSPEILHLDATRRFRLLDDASFDLVFSEHVIEHLSYEGGCTMLAECHRVLRPRGKIRISTPDLKFLVELYREDPSELQARYLAWSRQQYPGVRFGERAFVINNFVRDWGHQFIYDEPTLRRALERAGFVEIVSRALQESDEPAFRNLENERRMPPSFLRLETFTLEARKP